MGYKKTFRYSTGNPIVDEVGTMNFTGNVIPMVWFKTIRYPNGAPHNNAIHILADIVYWYRPKEERDEESGQLIGMKKKFRDDYLQRSYDQMAETFGLSKKQATEAVKALENMGIIKRIFKTIQVRGQILNNVLFIKWVPKRLYEVTFPKEIEENTLSPPKEIPLSVEGGRGIPVHLSTKIGHKFFNFLQLFPFFRQFIFLIYSSLFGLADPIRFFIIVKPACALLSQLWA